MIGIVSSGMSGSSVVPARLVLSSEPLHRKRDFVLKQVDIDRKPNGWLVTIPAFVSEANLDQQVKRFIEIADSDPGDGHMHIALFRKYHGGMWVASILEQILKELHAPHIALTLRKNQRSALIPFFERERDWHQEGVDADYGYPGNPTDLPI